MFYLRKSEDITSKNTEQNVYIVVLQNTFMYGILQFSDNTSDLATKTCVLVWVGNGRNESQDERT